MHSKPRGEVLRTPGDVVALSQGFGVPHPWASAYHFTMSTQWLRATDCPLLQHADDGVDVGLLRLVQRLLEIAMLRQTSNDVADTLLAEIAVQLRTDHVGIWEATP